MAAPALALEDLLAPITPDKPAGEDITLLPEWQEINQARRRDKLVGRQNCDWRHIHQIISAALAQKSKDLRLAVWLAEASMMLHGFRGLTDGLRLINGLLANFWNSGLYPEAEGGDTQFRAMSLAWLSGDNLPLDIRRLPLTARTDGGPDYSYIDYQQSRAVGFEKDVRNAYGDIDDEKQKRRDAAIARGAVSGEQFEEAVKATRRAGIEAISAYLDQAWSEFQELDRLVDEKFGNDAPGTSEARDAFEDCRRFVADLLKRKRQEEPDTPTVTEPGVAPASSTSAATPQVVFTPGVSDGDAGGSWAEAERLIQSGELERGLAEMTRLAAQEYGRFRFQHRLRLAEVCLNLKRTRIALAILEELAKQIEELQLAKWESPELLGRVWGRLYHCYKDEEPGSERAVRAAQLFSQLCHLDPWQALRWE